MRINKSLIAYTPTSGAGSGSVSSVALSAPTGFTVSGSPITTSGTLALSFTTGYGIPPLMTGNSGRFLTTNGTTMSWVNIAGTDITGAALTEADDTNVTMTLGGTPSTALLRSVSMSLGWVGQLAVSRGGTGSATLTGVVIGNGTSAMTSITGGPNQILRVNAGATGYEFYTASFLTNPMTLNFDMIYQSGGVPARLPSNITTTKQYLTSIGNGTATTSLAWASFTNADVPGDALTKVDDTNVTLTLGGTPSTAVLRATSLTMGWSGTLAVGRGGTGASTLTGALIGNGTSAFTAVVGTAGQFLRRNTANTAYEFRTLQGGDIAGSELTFTNDTNVTMSLSGTPASALLQPVNIGLGWTGTLSVSRGGIGVGTITGVMIGNGTSAVTGVTGTANQILRRNAGNTAYEFWSANYLVNPMTLEGSLIYATTGGTPAELFANSTSTRKYLSQINGTAPTWEAINAISGSGTINYVPIWTSSTALGNSPLYITGGEANFGNNKLVAGNVSAPDGSIMLQDNYSLGHLGNIGTMYGNGNLMLGYSVTPSTSSGTGFLSSAFITGTPLPRAAITIGFDILFYTESAQSIAIGSAVSMTERMRLTNAGNLGIGNTPSHKLDVNGDIGIKGAIALGSSGNYTGLYDNSNRAGVITGNASDATNYYRNTIHYLQSRDAATIFSTFSSSGLQINTGHLQLPSANYITWGGAYGNNIPTIYGTSGTGSNLYFNPGGSAGNKMILANAGQLTLTSYTSATSFPTTPTGILCFNGAGSICTMAVPEVASSGTYTPTWTGLANVDSTTAYSCQYMRVGNTVTVSGYLNINATVDNTLTRVRFTLPINSAVAAVNFTNGTAAAETGYPTGAIYGSTTDTGILEVTPPVDTGINYSFHFTYRLA